MFKKSIKNLISENEYWEIIGKSLMGPNNSITKQYKILIEIFDKLTEEQLFGFSYYATEFYRKAYTSELWAAVYIAIGGCGDDSFHYFRCWLATRDKKTYYNALKNPDSLVSEFKKFTYRDDLFADPIQVEVDEYYRQKYPQKPELLDVIEKKYKEAFKTKSELEMSEIIEFNWEENDKESLKKICPKIFEEYWNKPLKNKS